MSENPWWGETIEAGSARRITWLRLSSGRQPARDFFCGLPERMRDRFQALFRRMARSGPITNPIVYFKISGSEKIHAFRLGKYWMFCFTDNEKVVLLCGGAEVTGRLPRRLVERAEELRNEYVAAQKVIPLRCERGRDAK